MTPLCHNLSAAPHAARKTRSVPWRVQLGRIPRFRSDYVFPDARRKFHKLEPNAKTARPVQPPFQKLAKEIREPFVSVVLKVPGSRVCVLVIESLHDSL